MIRKTSNLMTIKRRLDKDAPEIPQNLQKHNSDVNVPVNKVYDSILQVVGNTPLVRLNTLPKEYGIKCEVYAKCEFLNPGGSIKDRTVLGMIDDATKHKTIHPESIFVEPTSGNTGIGIAFVSAIKGHKCIIMTPDKNSSEKLDTMRLLGAEVIQTMKPKMDLTIARKLKENDPKNVVMLNQFENEANPRIHYNTTGLEILLALGNIDMCVTGAGTGGTFSGIGQRLKDSLPECVLVVAEPDGSTMINTKGKSHPFLVEGMGGSWVPIVMDKSLIDHMEVVTDKESFLMARALATKEGLLCGGSSGAIMAAAFKAIKTKGWQEDASKRVVVVLPDGIRNYMSKFVSSPWMEAHHFMEPPQHTMKWWKDPVTELPFKHNYPKLRVDSTCKQVIDAMNEHNVNVAVIVDTLKHYVGAVSKDHIRNLATNPTRLPGEDCQEFNFDDSVEDHVDKNVYTLAINKTEVPTLGLLSRILDITSYVIIVKEGSDTIDFMLPIAVVTADDVLDYIQLHTKPCKQEF